VNYFQGVDMKKLVLILTLASIMFCVYATDFRVDDKRKTPAEAPTTPIPSIDRSRYVPEWEWGVEPVDLLNSYYDYFHAYTALTVSAQPDNMGGGTYLVYRTAESTGGIHNLSYSYVNESGVVTTSAGVGCEGRYGDSVVDPATGNVFVSFHQSSSDCIFLYDLYHIIQSPGLWLSPAYTLLDCEELQQNGTYPFDDDAFIWPKIDIGPSPLPDHRRVYVAAMNSTTSHGSEALPSENELIAYADFTSADLEAQSTLEWTFRTVEQMDAWNAEDPEWARPQISLAVHENIVIMFGYLAHSDINGYQDDELLVLINENYGEGDFEMYTAPASFEQENPTYIDTETDSLYYLYSDAGTPDIPYICKQDIIHSGHFNLVWNEDYTTISFAGSMGITFDSGTGPGYYYPGWNQIYPKRWTFDLTTHEFSFQDIYPKGADPNDDMPMQPWDLDEDGEFDAVYDDGMPMWENSWPIYYHDPDQAFHMNQTFSTANQEMGWQIMLWLDGTKSKLANDGITGYEGWGGYAEIACVISNDHGANWSEPFFINAKTDDENYSPALGGIKPCYMFPSDQIEVINANEHIGRVNLLFYDDEDFGSFVNGNAGLPNGGTYQFAALDIVFWSDGNTDYDIHVPPVPNLKAYPNPYTPGMTRAGITAEFISQKNASAQVSVYNIKGQKVADIFDGYLQEGEKMQVSWQAENTPAGIYFFKLDQAGSSAFAKVAVIK
jgi:hypothetical protein